MQVGYIERLFLSTEIFLLTICQETALDCSILFLNFYRFEKVREGQCTLVPISSVVS